MMYGTKTALAILAAGMMATTASSARAAEAQPQAAEKPAVSVYESRPAVEYTERDGLPNFMKKVKENKTLRVAYLGGSITAQNGWRVLSRSWLQKKYPGAKFEEIAAAIGGTGSDLGVFRVKQDVLDKKPDLLFVEFAVNDAGASPERIRRAMEGIVRQTWKAYPDCDICFVYTLTATHTPTFQKGLCIRSQGVMEEVADYYHIPSVNFGVEVSAMEKDGKLVMKSAEARMERVSGDELNVQAENTKDAQGRIIFSKDGVHPYTDTGHVLYMAALARAFEKLDSAGKPAPHTLDKPLDPLNWEAAKQLPLDQAVATNTGTRLDPAKDELAKRFRGSMPQLWQLKPGESLSFKFKGTKAAIYDLVGPGCGMVEVILDGKALKVRRFDSYCTYFRIATLGIGENLEDKEHTVEVRVLPDTIDKRTILFEHSRADYDKDPKKFAENNWYCGAVFVIGEIIK